MVDSPFHKSENPVDKVLFSLFKETSSTSQYRFKILIFDLMICVYPCSSVVKLYEHASMISAA